MTLPTATPIDRRSFLAGAAALPLARQRPRQAGGRLPLAAIAAGAAELIATHLGADPDDEAWVHGATALLARLDAPPPDPFAAMTAREQAFLRQHGWTFRRELAVPADGTRPAVICHQIHVPPDGAIPLHDHRDLFGAIVGVAGECEIRSFDIVDGGPDSAEVTLQERVRCWLAPGRFSLLTRRRDNVHEFRAGPQGARLLDLFVWLAPGAGSHDLVRVDDPAGRTDRRHRARWQV